MRVLCADTVIDVSKCFVLRNTPSTDQTSHAFTEYGVVIIIVPWAIIQNYKVHTYLWWAIDRRTEQWKELK
jgi:hypothetical protein